MWQLFEKQLKDQTRLAILARLDRDNSNTLHEYENCLGYRFAEFDSRATPSQVIAAAITEVDPSYILLINNPKAVIFSSYIERVESGILDLASKSACWALASGGGLCCDGVVRNAFYSSVHPSLPIGGGYYPIRDSLIDVLLFERGAAAEALTLLGGNHFEWGFEMVVLILGYLSGRVSIFAPFLSIGINGEYSVRDDQIYSSALDLCFGEKLHGESIQTYLGKHTFTDEKSRERSRFVPQLLKSSIEQTVLDHCSDFRVSVVTRTRFTRNHLLRRLLTSASRARLESPSLEIIIVSDVSKAEIDLHVDGLKRDFPYLLIKGCHNVNSGHSRTENLIAGIEQASGEYVLIVDDDDYIDPLCFTKLRSAFFLGQQPLILGDSMVHEEKWIRADDGRMILAQNVRLKTFSANHWREQFGGVNQLPICSGVFPKNVLTRRLIRSKMNYDLSEDYALFLLVLSDPHLPAIYEIPHCLCHISIRSGDDNSVTAPDRTAWTRDIAGFLYDIITKENAGLWQVISASPNQNNSIAEKLALDRIDQLERERRELISVLGRMKREIARRDSLLTIDRG